MRDYICVKSIQIWNTFIQLAASTNPWLEQLHASSIFKLKDSLRHEVYLFYIVFKQHYIRF